MIDELVLDVRFHGPFHVLTGAADDGVDAVVDTETPLPASGIKGVMRAAAGRLGIPTQNVAAVFGGRAGAGSPWHWTVDPSEVRLLTRSTVPIDEVSGTAKSGLIRSAQELWCASSTVRIRRLAWIPEDQRARHLDLLRCAARGVNALGHDRNRGYGWVSITEPGIDDEDAECARLAQLLLRWTGAAR